MKIFCRLGDEVHLVLNEFVNKQNLRICEEENSGILFGKPLNSQKYPVWCDFGIFFVESLNETAN